MERKGVVGIEWVEGEREGGMKDGGGTKEGEWCGQTVNDSPTSLRHTL